MQIQDKRVVVTGAASGIGKALCEAFNNAGAKSVVCVDMNIKFQTANDIGGLAVQVVGQKQILLMLLKANEYSGGIDISVPAGIGGVHSFSS